ncbi:hypothetical protein BDY17DRAFT_315251 [Neohortaea acidophila]|uniref:PHD-type domain-containing protein n=1 Tax=Neohortaea acidophila TaxID=245834 RepID=A0A6A6Q362_9PEZI|nr:uncharacterized protein BDY17DRAFT_315251 [Neohortaea acidophila]KAF2486444.1 hypothetical protein BDY17DRAFT_315251 [Neohortaea acidophila]
MAASLAPDFRSLSRQAPTDPDIQATLSDFLTYTEHFPSQFTRALALIASQREHAERKIGKVHEYATQYSILPSIENGKPDPVQLRRDISYALEEAERACRMAVEEAGRLDDTCERESRRLDVVIERLKAQPMPPSRDPTPEQSALTSPNLKRERRMSTRGDDIKPESRKLQDKAATKLRGRKVMVPGEVLPPPDPNAPAESISDWTSPRHSPPLEEPPLLDKKATPRPRSRTPKVPKSSEKDRKTPKPRGPRAPGQPGTNAHSAVAGISTSNALLALTQPPDDAPKGSKWLPWMKLTEWEMAKLRKRMKKNAIWVPSQTMVRRELKNLGRGVAGREAARKSEEEGGPAFVDEHEPDPTKVLISGEESAQINAILGNDQLYMDDGGDDADQELINRGMRLNEAKKLKRQRMLEDQRLQEEQELKAQIAREQGIEVAEGKVGNKDGKKRKRESTPLTTGTAMAAETPDPLTKAGPAPKRLKLNASKVPLAPPGASASSPTKPSSSRNRRVTTPPISKSRPTLVLKASKAVSEEPPNRRAALRRASIASLPNGNLTSPRIATANKSGRRNRRPAPGILTTADAESAKVGVSKRKAAPHKKGSTAVSKAATAANTLLPEPVTEEYIDPDEPRYCICGDVSWGTMIACDNEENCEKEWFHLSCVGLQDLPPRRTKWYCPDCRKRLKKGVESNGLVGRPSGR